MDNELKQLTTRLHKNIASLTETGKRIEAFKKKLEQMEKHRPPK